MIYFDMDGVLADFDGTYETLTGAAWGNIGIPDRSTRLRALSEEEKELKWMTGMKDFMARLRHKVGDEHIGILSAASHHIPESADQKQQWLERETPWILQSNRLIVTRKRDKALYASGNILVDDFDVNINNWRQAGGIGVLFTSADQAESELNRYLGF
jgi:5'(3')-deoxyribonucleotidase